MLINHPESFNHLDCTLLIYVHCRTAVKIQALNRLTDSIVELDLDFMSDATLDNSIHSVRIQQADLNAMWDKIKVVFNDLLATESLPAKDLNSIRKKTQIKLFDLLKM